MKIIEQYYGPVRRHQLDQHEFFNPLDMEAYVRVEVNGRILQVKTLVNKQIPAKFALADCQRQIMFAVQKEIFGVS